MFSSAIFDTILGLVFVFYATAVVCSSAVEMFANWARKRAKYLLRGLRELLDDPGTIWTATESNPQAGPRTMIGKSAAPGDEKAHYTVALGRAWPDTAAEAKLKALWSTQLINHPLLKPYKHYNRLGEATRIRPTSRRARSCLPCSTLSGRRLRRSGLRKATSPTWRARSRRRAIC